MKPMRWPIVALFALLFLLGTGGSPAWAQTPQMLAAVDIQAPSLQASLGIGRARVEDELATRLAGVMQARHPYVAWVSARADAVLPDAAMGQLVATVVDKPGAAGGSGPVVLVWQLRTAARTSSVDLGDDITIYPPFDLRHSAHNPDKFIQHVDGRLQLETRHELFRKHSFDRLLSLLPVARGAVLVVNERVVVLPLNWQKMRPGPKSEFLVRFTRPAADGGGSGQAMLSSVAERRGGDAAQRGWLQAAVIEMTANAQPVSAAQHWNALPQWLKGAQVLCYIKSFKPDEFGADDLARPLTRPEP